MPTATTNPGLHSGILMHQGKASIELPSHIDMQHVAMLEGPSQPSHYGTLDLWAFQRKPDVPFLSLAGIGSNNIMYVKGKYFTYDVATASDQSISIVRDISGQDQVGRGKSEFEILVNSNRLGGHGQVFKFDNMGKEELIVTDARIRQQDGHWVYTVKRQDSDKPVPKMYLEPNTKLFPSHTEMSPEFNQSYASMNVKTPKTNQFIVPVGQTWGQVHYHITTEAAEYNSNGTISIPQSTKSKLDDAFEYYFNMTGVDTNGLTNFSDVVKTQPNQVRDAMNEGRVSVALSTMFDSLALKFLAKGEESYLLWGSGGYSDMGGVDTYLKSVGAWQQFDTGYKKTFNVGDASLDMITAAIWEYLGDKVDVPSPGTEPTFDVQTGLGGFKLANQWITQAANDQSVVVNVRDFNNIQGTGPFNLGYTPSWFTTLTIPMLCKLRFIYTPALDPQYASDLTNPYVGSHRLSSYSFIIYGENELSGAGNIKLIRSTDAGGKVFMNIINGTSSHPLTRFQGPNGTIASQGADLKTGYAAYFRKKMDSLWVVDPTRILKIMPINPKTGLSF